MGNPTGVSATKKKGAAKRTATKTSIKGTGSRKPRVLAPKKTEARPPSSAGGKKESLISKPRPRVLRAKRIEPVAPPKALDRTEPLLSEAQALVAAAKLAGPEIPPEAGPRPSLPSTHGESHMLLLARDPQTLFAAWDMAPSVVEDLKARIGRRSFEVSTLTLRLTPAGGRPGVFHVGKRTRSHYLRVEGGPSFVGEIGFTTPAGRFELVASSAPCFVSMGVGGAPGRGGTEARKVLSYRDAISLARRGVALETFARATGTRPGRGTGGSPVTSETPGNSLSSRPPTARVLGGASDLYRR